MIVDQQLRVNNGESVRESDPDYSSPIDLTVSPDIANGTELYAVIIINEYAAGSNTAVTFNVVTSSAEALSSSPRTLGSVTLTATQLEARDVANLAGAVGDGGAGRQPIVIRINPDQDSITPLVSSVDERYLGIEYDHASAAPTTMKVTAYFTTSYQSNPAHANHASGSQIL